MYKIILSLHRIVYTRGSTSNLQHNVKGKQRHWGNKGYEKKLTWSWLWSLKTRSRPPVLCRGTLWRLKLGTLLKNHTKRWLKWVWTSEFTSLSDQFAGYRHIWGRGEARGGLLTRWPHTWCLLKVTSIQPDWAWADNGWWDWRDSQGSEGSEGIISIYFFRCPRIRASNRDEARIHFPAPNGNEPWFHFPSIPCSFFIIFLSVALRSFKEESERINTYGQKMQEVSWDQVWRGCSSGQNQPSGCFTV